MSDVWPVLMSKDRLMQLLDRSAREGGIDMLGSVLDMLEKHPEWDRFLVVELMRQLVVTAEDELKRIKGEQ